MSDSDKDFVKGAAQTLGLSVKALGDRIGKKSLERVAWGSIELHPSQRVHIEHLLTIETLRREKLRLERLVRESAEETQGMPPPHEMLPSSYSSRVQESPSEYKSENEYAKAVANLRELFERNPESFRSAAAMIKGLYDSVKK